LDGFTDFWYDLPETEVWNPPSGLVCTQDNCPSCHAVVCTGYNDTDPDNRYWVMLNSWGTAYGNRPNGLFRVNMDMNYSSIITDQCVDPPDTFASYYWETIDVTFKPLNNHTHDVAVLNVEPSKTVVCEGYGMNITVAVENQGDLTETFNLTVYADETEIGTREAILADGSSTIVTFTWNTTGFAKYENYTVSAYVHHVFGETDLEDNEFVDNKVTVAMVGDINADGKVDMKDVGTAAKAFGTYLGDERWNQIADINNDNKVDMRDVGTVAKEFGKIL